MAEKLKPEDMAAELNEVSQWVLNPARDALSRSLSFRNFREAFAFMTEVALVAEKMDHHPDWSNVYRSVDITLSTHSAGGLSRLDIELAAAIDEIARRFE